MLKNLIKYYIEIVERDTLERVSYPGFNQDKDFINFSLDHEWSTVDDQFVIKPSEFRKQLALTAKVSTVYYGWPIYARMAISKKSGKQYSWIEPLFLLKADYSAGDSKASLIKEYPKINDSILRRQTDSIEERLHLVEQLGINDVSVERVNRA